MASVNDHTRKMQTTAIKETTAAYREGWERIFGAKSDDGCSWPSCPCTMRCRVNYAEFIEHEEGWGDE